MASLKKNEFWVIEDKAGKVVVNEDFGDIVAAKTKNELVMMDIFAGDTIRKAKIEFID